MRLWLSKNSDVPLREQLVRQIMLGVVSDDLKPGQRLPSTRELARRFRIHSNTVSAAYGELERRGWLEFRKGSGVYVRPLAEVQERVKHWLGLEPPDHFLVVEPDEGLREILAAEIAEATGFRVRGAGLEECRRDGATAGAVVVALYRAAEGVGNAPPPGGAP